MCYNDIINLNNKAIIHLQKDSTKQAVHFLYDGLCRTRIQFRQLKEKEKSTASRQQEGYEQPHRPSKKRRIISSDTPSPASLAPIALPLFLNTEIRNLKKIDLSLSSSSTDNGNHNIYSVKVEQKQQQKQKQHVVERGDNCNSLENLFSFYKRAFIISSSTKRTGDDDGTCKRKRDIGDTTGNNSNDINSNDDENMPSNRSCLLTRLYIVLLYNIGFIFHREGISNNSHKQLWKAIEFYNYGMSIIQMEWKNINVNDMLLLLAISNNLGYVHSHLLNFFETKKSILWLRELMKANDNHGQQKNHQQCNLTQNSNVKNCSNILSQEEHDFFFRNVYIFDEKIQILSCSPTA